MSSSTTRQKIIQVSGRFFYVHRIRRSTSWSKKGILTTKFHRWYRTKNYIVCEKWSFTRMWKRNGVQLNTDESGKREMPLRNALKLYIGGFFLKLQPDGEKSMVFILSRVTRILGLRSSTSGRRILFTPSLRLTDSREEPHVSSTCAGRESMASTQT